MRFRLVLFLSALVAMFSVSTGAALAGDKAVLSDDPFRLDSRYLEPGCYVDCGERPCRRRRSASGPRT